MKRDFYYIIYNTSTYKINSTHSWMGKEITAILSGDKELACINITHPKSKDILVRINEVNGTDYSQVNSKFLDKPLFVVGDEVRTTPDCHGNRLGEITGVHRLFVPLNEDGGWVLDFHTAIFEYELQGVQMVDLKLKDDLLTVTQQGVVKQYLAYAYYYDVESDSCTTLRSEHDLLVFNQWAIKLRKRKHQFINSDLEKDVRGLLSTDIWGVAVDASDDKSKGNFEMRFCRGQEDVAWYYYASEQNAKRDLAMILSLKASLVDVNE